jgi:APA family basic amino acid/polyamine antiporter
VDPFYKIGNFAEEMEEPHRNIPIAVIGGTAIVILLYVIINVAYLSVCTVDAVANADQLAILVMETALGEAAGLIAAGLVLADVMFC